ncbi:MAG: hypothetical protein F6K10_15410 [Moorea sp. SIO2B7]|nr:hypothetical protein [Moorena sp. SIO2B7]
MKLPIQSPGNEYSTSTITQLLGVFPNQSSKSCSTCNCKLDTADGEKDKIYELLTNTREVDLERISSLDSTTFTIKGWSVTLAIALIGLAIQQHNRTFLYLGIGATILFALFDFFYRKIQLSHVKRVVKIEKYLGLEYLNEIEELKNLFKPFYANPGKNFTRDYLIPVFLVYLIMILVLIFLSFLSHLY